MASFQRDLEETLTIENFLSGNFGPSKVGSAISQYIQLFTEFEGSEVSQQTALFDEFSGAQQENGNFPIQIFEVEGEGEAQKLHNYEIQGQGQGQKLNNYEVFGESDSREYGLNIDRSLIESITIVDDLDVQGDFTRDLSEGGEIFGRVGQSKGVFFRSTNSAIVSSNSQVRKFDFTPGAGQIAVSERPTSGPFKILRKIPGTTIGSPNTVNLGSIPTIPGSQGWILDDSPNGVLLRGTWEVRLIFSDTKAEGQIRIHASLYSVKATPTGVQKVAKIGITQVTSPFTPSVSEQEKVLTWTQAEAGEIFLDSDEYIYVELYIQEISHPVTTASSIFRLDNIPHTLYSRMRYPGVSDETTYQLPVPAETLTFSDFVQGIRGAIQSIAENIPVSGTVTRNIGYQRTIIDTNPLQIDEILAGKYVLKETITLSDQVDRQVNNVRSLIENIPIVDSVDQSESGNKVLNERLMIEGHLSGYIIRPPRRRLTDNINKRLLDPVARERLQNFNKQ